MTVETNKKSDRPTCACGKTDLYEEWLKQNEKGISENLDPEAENDTEAHLNSETISDKRG